MNDLDKLPHVFFGVMFFIMFVAGVFTLGWRMGENKTWSCIFEIGVENCGIIQGRLTND